MQRLRTADYRIGDHMPVESGQPAAVSTSQGQQVGISHLAGVEKAIAVDALAVEEGDVVGPECVAAQGEENRNQFGNGGRGSG
jgi:hypothetical protein